MKTVLVFLFCLFSLSESSGFLRLDLTADRDCLLHLEHSFYYSQTIRLVAYETQTLEIYSQSTLPHLPITLQLLHHFSGKPLSGVTTQQFDTENNGRLVSRVVDSEAIILSVQSTFYCENGYFGPLCEHKSVMLKSPTAAVSSDPSIGKFPFEISNDLIIYCSLAFLVLLLVVANIFVCCGRPRPTHVYQDTLPHDVSEFKVFCIDESTRNLSELNYSDSRYYDAPSRFYSSVTLQSRV